MMNCTDTHAPNDENMLRAVIADEPFTPDAQQHLATCAICQKRFSDYQIMHHSLDHRLYRIHCPSTMLLNQYVEKLLSADAAMPIAEHLTECVRCAIEVADIRHIMNNFDPFAYVEALPMSQTLANTLRRIIAQFIPMQPQLITRSIQNAQDTSGTTDWPRQYRAETLDISLHLSRASNGDTMLLGLLTSTDDDTSVDAFEGATAKLYLATPDAQSIAPHDEEQTPLLTTQIDDMGNLVFPAVPTGNYTMIVCLNDTEIVLEGLSIEHG